MEVEFPALLKNVVPVAVVAVAAATTVASATLAQPSALRLLLLLPVGISPVLGILVGAAVRILVLVGSPGLVGAPATAAVLGARATASEETLTSDLPRAA